MSPSPSRTLRLFLLSLGVKLLAALWGVLLARVLGADAYGQFAFVLAVIAGVQLLSDGGVSHYLAREVSRTGLKSNRKTVRAALLLQGVLGLVGGVVAALLVVLGPSRLEWFLIFGVGLLVPLFSISQVFRGVLRGTGRTALELFLQLVGYIALCIALLLAMDGVEFAFAVFSYPMLLCPLYLWYFVSGRRLFRGERASARVFYRRAAALFVRALPLNALGTLGMLLTRLDVLILGFLVAPSMLGAYAAASQVLFAAVSVASSASVALIALFAKKSSPNGVLTTNVAQYFSLGLLASGASWALSGWAPAIFGPGYEDSESLIRVLALALPAAYVSVVLGQYLIATRNEKASLWILSVCVLYALGGFWFAASRWGTMGVAWVTVSLFCARALLESAVVVRFRRRKA